MDAKQLETLALPGKMMKKLQLYKHVSGSARDPSSNIGEDPESKPKGARNTLETESYESVLSGEDDPPNDIEIRIYENVLKLSKEEC
jgi:hypothetical protein